ncbi:hypothetical protein E0500_005600 [Streptomyces sp. KM273126]|uniref:hypothetical protein n=1 Tax=Streptomyces sp. KM273126 TaxID=2545247 RepID=UPI001404C0C8|nr:hypothetical protein [Streptomyces sp. KM273126]MBA2806931.1 hypothetical protein [Streptomyces sp. KM273126]
MTSKQLIIAAKDIPAAPQGIGGYCWATHTGKGVHCTEPHRHSGRHWHPYTKTSW